MLNQLTCKLKVQFSGVNWEQLQWSIWCFHNNVKQKITYWVNHSKILFIHVSAKFYIQILLRLEDLLVRTAACENKQALVVSHSLLLLFRVHQVRFLTTRVKENIRASVTLCVKCLFPSAYLSSHLTCLCQNSVITPARTQINTLYSVYIKEASLVAPISNKLTSHCQHNPNTYQSLIVVSQIVPWQKTWGQS